MKASLRCVPALALLTLFLPGNGLGQEFPNNIVGYFTSWSVYGRNYHVPDIPPEKINYINYAFANINPGSGTIILGDAYADTDKWYPGDSWHPDSLRGSFHRLQILKASNPHVRTLISVGGWTWSTYFSDIALTQQSREVFAASCVDFIQEYEFDGVDIDWEYPVAGGLPGNIRRPEDRENFTALLAELRYQLDQAGDDYLLTIATSASPIYLPNLELDLIIQHVDWINIMTYDFHGPWGGAADFVTNFNSALVPCPDDPTGEPYHSYFNLVAAVNGHIDAGVPASQIHAGIPFYGRGYGNVANSNNGLFASYSGSAAAGTWENGVFDYWDLAQNYIDKNGYTSFWQNDAMVPWLYNPTTQIMISYDDPQAIEAKADVILDMNLGGAMFWEFSADKNSELLDPLYEALNGSSGMDESNWNTVENITGLAVGNHPNPFGPYTNMQIHLPQASSVDIQIFDLHGRLVATLNMQNQSAGDHEIVWNGRDNTGKLLPAGVYQSLTITDVDSASHRMVIIDR